MEASVPAGEEETSASASAKDANGWKLSPEGDAAILEGAFARALWTSLQQQPLFDEEAIKCQGYMLLLRRRGCGDLLLWRHGGSDQAQPGRLRAPVQQQGGAQPNAKPPAQGRTAALQHSPDVLLPAQGAGGERR